MQTCDFLVIGGGSAGYAAARTASDLGLQTVVVEGGPAVGGLCILRGCMPTKALLESSHRVHAAAQGSEFGFRAGKVVPDWKRIQARKNALIGDFASHRVHQLNAGRFRFLRGRARFLDPQTVEIQPLGRGRRQMLRPRTVLLSTGSVVALRDFPGLAETGFITSDEAIVLERPLKSLAVLGGGAVALELAQYFHQLGVNVTVIQRSDRILSDADAAISSELEAAFAHQGLTLLTGTQLRAFERAGAGRKRVLFERNGRKQAVVAEEILYALGRRPAVEGLGLEAAGIRTAHGHIAAKTTQQTSQSHVFAAGDVAGPYEIVHIAIQQGEVAARNAARLLGKLPGSRLERTDYRLKMSVVFTQPEAAWCGQTETELRGKGVAYKAASYPFNDHGKSMIMGAKHGFVKLLARESNGEILGGQIVGPSASDMIHEIVMAMRFRCTVHQFKAVPHYHPTLAEILTYPAEELSAQVRGG